MRHGSLINALATTHTVPEVGMGATILLWTDRQAGTIVGCDFMQDGRVKKVYVQRDKAVRTDDRSMSDWQEWDYSPDPDGVVEEFRLVTRGRQKGEYVAVDGGARLLVGVRDHYHDYSF